MSTQEKKIDLGETKRSMKPMLAECVTQAVHLALIDSVSPEAEPDAENFENRIGTWTPEQRAAMEMDIFAIPSEAIARMDPLALAQNVCCRLLGTGGWVLPTPDGPMYTGNATASEVFEASFDRPNRDHGAEVAFDVMKVLREAEESRDV